MKTIRKNTTGYKEENLKEGVLRDLQPQALELVPTYNADENIYVLDLSNYHNHDILIRGGWNELDKSTNIILGYCQDFNNIGKALYLGFKGMDRLNDESYTILHSTSSYFWITSGYGYEDNDNILIQCRNNDVKICPYILI